MQELKNEAGRSMVEMLGVLAIIGVLSIVGLAGYRQAMNKVIANEAVNLANQIYVAQLVASNGACSPLDNADVSSKGYEVPAVLGAAASIKASVTCPTDSANGKVKLTGGNLGKAATIVSGMGLSNPVVEVAAS